MEGSHSASYSRLLEKLPHKSIQDSYTASISEDTDFRHETYVPPSQEYRKGRVMRALFVTMAVVYVCGSLAFMSINYRRGQHNTRGPSSPYTPAANVIRYVTAKSADGYDEDLQGFPSEAHDKAWLDLVAPALSRASYEEMRLGSEDPEHSVAVGDDKGGYMVSLGVYHELHCLRRLKLYLHKEHYYPKLSHGSDEDTYELNHLNHCLEAIRLSLMCAGNTALYSFQWPGSNEKVRKPKTKTNSERTCVDWEAIDVWAHNRSIGMNPRLKRPVVELDHAHMGHDTEKSS